MHPLSLALGLGGGAVVGIIVGMVLGKKQVAQVSASLEQVQSELERVRKETGNKLKKLQADEAAAKKDLNAAREKLTQIEEASKKSKSEVEQAKEQLKELEEAKARTAEQAAAHQQARQQAEGKLKQAEKLAAEHKAKLDSVQSKLSEAQSSAQEAGAKAAKQNEELSKLRARLRDGGGGPDDKEIAEVFKAAGGSLQKILDTLMEKEDQTAAVLADANGIVVAAAGEKSLRDGIAATAQMFSTLSSQFKGMVPFGSVESFHVSDNDSVVISGRAFKAAGETITLSTYGQHLPSDRMLQTAMVNLSSALD